MTTKQSARVQEDRNQDIENRLVSTLRNRLHGTQIKAITSPPCVPIDSKRLESFYGSSEDREESRDNWYNKQAVDEVELVAVIVVEQLARLEHPVEEEAEGEEGGGHGVRVGEEAMSCWLVDELCPKHNGCHHTCDKADGADDDVQVGEVHLAPQVAAQAEEDKAEGEDEDTDSNHKVDCHHPHLVFRLCWGRWSRQLRQQVERREAIS